MVRQDYGPGGKMLRPSLSTAWLLLACGCASNELTPEKDVVREPESNGQIAIAAQAQVDASGRYEWFRSQLQARLDRHSADLERRHPRPGVTTVPLQGRFGHAVAARRTADGRIEYGCFTDADQTARFVTKTTSEQQP
jgi:hypothetical protein